jgi:hypothetical protein
VVKGARLELTKLFSGLGAEFNKICLRTALGFVVMGFIGFFVKLIFIVRRFSPPASPSSALPAQLNVYAPSCTCSI